MLAVRRYPNGGGIPNPRELKPSERLLPRRADVEDCPIMLFIRVGPTKSVRSSGDSARLIRSRAAAACDRARQRWFRYGLPASASKPRCAALLPHGSAGDSEIKPFRHAVLARATRTIFCFRVNRPGRARSLGFIPVGWYPTSVRVTAGRQASACGQRQRDYLQGQSEGAPAGRSTIPPTPRCNTSGGSSVGP